MKKLLFVILGSALLAAGLYANGGPEQPAAPGASPQAQHAPGQKVQQAAGPTLKAGILSIGMEESYPPFEYMDTDGKTPIGFDVDFGKALAAKLGVQAQFINTSFDGIFAGLDKGDYDCAISAITVTKARVDNGNFCNPYVSNALALVGLKGSKVAPKDPMACAGMQVSYQAETTADYYMQGLAKKGLKFTPREYDSVETAFTDMKLKRVDVVITDSTVAADYLRSADSPYVLLWQSAPSEFFGIALKKGNDALTQALDKAQDELFADGTMLKLSQKWLGGDMVSTAKGVTPVQAAAGAH